MVRDKGRIDILIHILTWQGGFLFDTGLNDTTAFAYLGEPSLDLQYSMALVYPQVCCCERVLDLTINYELFLIIRVYRMSFCTRSEIWQKMITPRSTTSSMLLTPHM